MLHLYLATVALSLSLVLVLEAFTPLHPSASPPLNRWLHNAALSALALGVTLGVPFILHWLGQRWGWSPARSGLTSWGLASWGLPMWAQWLLTFLIIDGTAYALHRLSHRVHWLWRLHAIHHNDIELDVTTTHRHHPLENLVGVLVTLPVLLFLAPPWAAVLVYSLLAVWVSTFSHGNLRLPARLDKLLRWVVVTPGYHRVHHSAHQPQTDSNYATVLPLFDHVFRTTSAVPPDGGRDLIIGLQAGRDRASQSIARLLASPFRRAVVG